MYLDIRSISIHKQINVREALLKLRLYCYMVNDFAIIIFKIDYYNIIDTRNDKDVINYVRKRIDASKRRCCCGIVKNSI